MKKALAALALVGSIALVGAGPAMAQPTPYPAPTSDGNVDDGTVAPGETFNFILTGFGPFESITITITLTGAPQAIGGSFSGGASMAVPAKITLPLAPQTLTVTADANGNVTVPLSLTEAGTYTLTAVGTSGKTVTSVVTVDAAAGSGLANTGGAPVANTGAGLANTGADSGLVLWTLVGAGALAAGAASVVVVRRRAKTEAAA
jgi:LPXTG-motif cell wall-anchored protein